MPFPPLPHALTAAAARRLPPAPRCSSTAVKKLLDENQLPHLLFYGPPGTGKTSTILAIARQIYGPAAANMTLELNASGALEWVAGCHAGLAVGCGLLGMRPGCRRCSGGDAGGARIRTRAVGSRRRQQRAGPPLLRPSPAPSNAAADDRGIAVVRNEIQDFASTRTIFSSKFKLVILDECDAMTKDAQMALRRGAHRRACARFPGGLGGAAGRVWGVLAAWALPLPPSRARSSRPGHACRPPPPACPLPRSDGEVHAQRALLPHLQLRVQDHPGPAVALHALPLPAAARAVCAQPPGLHLRGGGVRCRAG